MVGTVSSLRVQHGVQVNRRAELEEYISRETCTAAQHYVKLEGVHSKPVHFYVIPLHLTANFGK